MTTGISSGAYAGLPNGSCTIGSSSNNSPSRLVGGSSRRRMLDRLLVATMMGPMVSSGRRRRRRDVALLAALCGLAGLALVGLNVGSILGSSNNDGSAEGLKTRHGRGSRHLGRHLSAPTTSLDEVGEGSNGSSGGGEDDSEKPPRKKKPPREKKRLAVVRPYGASPADAAEMLTSFDSWDPHWPCTSSDSNMGNNEEDDEYEYEVDLYLSFSRRYYSDSSSSDPTATTPGDPLYPHSLSAMSSLQTKFDSNSGWYGCFSDLYHIESDIPSHMDLYSRDHVQLDRHWVNGPNSQFRSIMDAILMRNAGGNDAEGVPEGEGMNYELVLILEPDAHVRRVGWLDALLDDVTDKRPFAMLGSKYKGHSWDNFKDQLSHSLLNHLNGNAVYNLTHPLTLNIIHELHDEADTLFNAIPFDYRISQIITEGKLGIPPEFPFPEMRDETGKWSVTLPAKTDKFRGWWDQYGGGGCGGGANYPNPDSDHQGSGQGPCSYEDNDGPIKESAVITNFAATNYLPEHLGPEPIVHGDGAYAPWDGRLHQITLVVTDWNENFGRTLLSNLDSSDHPYSEVLIMREPPNPSSAQLLRTTRRQSFWTMLWEAITPPVSTRVPFRYQVREESSDYMDLCNAPVTTEWFMLTNSYHQVVPNVDLMFTNEDPPRPLIPYTPASSKHCTDYAACRETFGLARELYPDLDRVVLDLDMLYHTPSRNAFCARWREENGARGEVLSMRVGGIEAYVKKQIPRGPTATAYLAYLYSSGMAENIYAFTNRLDHGAKDAFIKVHAEAEAERHPAKDEAYWIHRILRESEGGFFSRVWVWTNMFGRGQNPTQATPVAPTTAQAASQGTAPPAQGTKPVREASLFQRFKNWWVPEATAAPATHPQTQEPGPAQETKLTRKPSFIQRMKTWWGKGKGGESSDQGEEVESVNDAGSGDQYRGSALGAATSRTEMAQCAAAGAEAKDCIDGKKGNMPRSCCTGLTCSADGSGKCVVLGNYGGGEVTRGLTLTAPGLLVHA